MQQGLYDSNPVGFNLVADTSEALACTDCHLNHWQELQRPASIRCGALQSIRSYCGSCPHMCGLSGGDNGLVAQRHCTAIGAGPP
jgi:hypothetical protein